MLLWMKVNMLELEELEKGAKTLTLPMSSFPDVSTAPLQLVTLVPAIFKIVKTKMVVPLLLL